MSELSRFDIHPLQAGKGDLPMLVQAPERE